jgi:CBS domain-containing protein
MQVRDAMATGLITVQPRIPVTELEQRLIEHRVSGFPVEEDGKLVGVVTRSDIIRTLTVERTYEEQLSDYYSAPDPFDSADATAESVVQTGSRIGARIEEMTVRDVMSRKVLTADPSQSLEEVARVMVERSIHRLPVTQGDKLVGIITTLDLARQIADGRLKEA